MKASEPHKKARGSVSVKSRICKGCSFCIDFCPSHCLEFSTDFNAKGYHYPVMAHPEDCTGCDLCGLYCPDFAINGYKFIDRKKHAQVVASAVMAV
jgi:2-oxoglutarate ferredoxin oxidoreductase subunit delta